MTSYIDEHWGSGQSLPNFAPTKANDAAILQWWGKFERLGASPSVAIALMLGGADDVLVSRTVKDLVAGFWH